MSVGEYEDKLEKSWITGFVPLTTIFSLVIRSTATETLRLS